MGQRNLTSILISGFVISWLAVFHYESSRLLYLEPFFKRPLPKVKFLFPPAGWIMFYQVGEEHSQAQVYGIQHDKPVLIDPHRIFETRWVGYDNIRRNVLLSVLDPSNAPDFCPYLKRKFPEFGKFVVAYAVWPSVIENANETYYKPVYSC